MPCNTIVVNKVAIDKVPDKDLLLKALQKEFGYVDHNLGAAAGAERWFKVEVKGRPVFLRGERVESSLPQAELLDVVGRAKRAYSAQVMAAAAKRFGWANEVQDATHGRVVRRG